jgi:hypothetical protein
VVIHQIQIKYDASADRLLMQVRTRDGEHLAVWLTRRMVQRLWAPFQQVVTQLAMAQATPGAVARPEARATLAEAARSTPLPGADFSQKFAAAEPGHKPLGQEPLLATEIELQSTPARGLRMKLREQQGRNFALQINEELAVALLRLLEQALLAADWGLRVETPPAADNPAATLLN